MIEISDWRALDGDPLKAALGRKTRLCSYYRGRLELLTMVQASTKVLLRLDCRHLGRGPRNYNEPCETFLIPDHYRDGTTMWSDTEQQ